LHDFLKEGFENIKIPLLRNQGKVYWQENMLMYQFENVAICKCANY